MISFRVICFFGSCKQHTEEGFLQQFCKSLVAWLITRKLRFDPFLSGCWKLWLEAICKVHQDISHRSGLHTMEVLCNNASCGRHNNCSIQAYAGAFVKGCIVQKRLLCPRQGGVILPMQKHFTRHFTREFRVRAVKYLVDNRSQ
ncbi:unnamed protein product [Calypogeia fissa]